MTKDIEPLTLIEMKGIIRDSIEKTEPADSILLILKEYEGKKFNRGIIKKIIARINDNTITFNPSYGMNHIEWGEYRYNHGRTGGSILIGYGDNLPIIDTKWIYEHNGAYYSARDKRNIQRNKILNNDDMLSSFVNDVNTFILCKNVWERRKEEWFRFEDTFDVIQYTIRDRIGEKR